MAKVEAATASNLIISFRPFLSVGFLNSAIVTQFLSQHVGGGVIASNVFFKATPRAALDLPWQGHSLDRA